MQVKDISINYDYNVLIKCMTYNHSKFIIDALEGFAMQQTKWPFVCLVVDDASLDGTQNVIEEFIQQECSSEKTIHYSCIEASIIVSRHKNNDNCIFVFYLLTKNMYKHPTEKDNIYISWCKKAKYIAICEGDDYWTEPAKLQKQIDFLENNTEYAMCYTGFNVVSSEKKYIISKNAITNQKKSLSGDIFTKLLKGNFIQTMTVCYKNGIEDMLIYKNCPTVMDWSLFLSLAWIGKCKFFPDVTSAYRHHDGSMSRSNHNWIDQRGIIIKDYFYLMYLKERRKKTSLKEDLSLKINIVKNIFRHSIDNKRFFRIAEKDSVMYLLYPFGFLFHYVRKLKNILSL